MPTYLYKALDTGGATVKGEIDAHDEAAVVAALSARSMSAFEVRERPPQFEMRFGGNRLSARERVRFVRQLATLLDAGLSLLDALQSLAKSKTRPATAAAAGLLLRSLRAGVPLSGALDEHMPELPPYVPRLAELGEATGRLPESLGDAADRLEFEDSLRADIRTALAYPAFLATVGTLLVILLFI
ncbi:MAG: type II secretion system F family protein, partial [Litorimonas sp.]